MPPLSVTTGPAFAFAIRTWEGSDAMNTVKKCFHAHVQWHFSYLTTPTQLILYSCHEWPVGQSKNLYGDIIPSLAKLAWGFSVVCNHHKLVAVASYYLNIVGIIYQVLFMIYLRKHSTSIETVTIHTFSWVWHPPPPFMRVRASSASSQPSIVTSILCKQSKFQYSWPHLGSVSRSESTRPCFWISCRAWKEVGMHLSNAMKTNSNCIEVLAQNDNTWGADPLL